MTQVTKTGSDLEVTTPTPQTVLISRVFDAARERVWRAHTEPELVAQWWGRGNHIDIERFEVERGGHWRFVEHADGEKHGFEGRFREVTPQETLAYTFEWDGMPGYVVVDTLKFVDLGDGRTRLDTTALFFTEQERDGMLKAGMTSGLTQSYAALDGVLAKLARD